MPQGGCARANSEIEPNSEANSKVIRSWVHYSASYKPYSGWIHDKACATVLVFMPYRRGARTGESLLWPDPSHYHINFAGMLAI